VATRTRVRTSHCYPYRSRLARRILLLLQLEATLIQGMRLQLYFSRIRSRSRYAAAARRSEVSSASAATAG